MKEFKSSFIAGRVARRNRAFNREQNMFPAGFFGPRYFPATYWPKASLSGGEGAPSASFAVRERVSVFLSERRGAVFERRGEPIAFTSTSRGVVFGLPPRGVVFLVEEP